MDARLGDLLPAVGYATTLIEKQAAVVEAARKLVGGRARQPAAHGRDQRSEARPCRA